MPDLPENVQADIRQHLEREVRSGFADLDTLAHDAGEILSDDAEPDDIEAFARRALQDILIDYRAEQKRWPAITDCDRLDGAFEELETRGIVARQNFSCCGTCGCGEIGEEMENASNNGGSEVRGYTFYHMQDTERAIEGDGIYLYYGSTAEGEAEALEIAREIQDTLQRYGLNVDWDGTYAKRIGVALDWKRRLPV